MSSKKIELIQSRYLRCHRFLPEFGLKNIVFLQPFVKTIKLPDHTGTEQIGIKSFELEVKQELVVTLRTFQINLVFQNFPGVSARSIRMAQSQVGVTRFQHFPYRFHQIP